MANTDEENNKDFVIKIEDEDYYIDEEVIQSGVLDSIYDEYEQVVGGENEISVIPDSDEDELEGVLEEEEIIETCDNNPTEQTGDEKIEDDSCEEPKPEENKVKQTCGSTTYATCVTYEGTVNGNSNVKEEPCLTIEETTQDIYNQLDDIDVKIEGVENLKPLKSEDESIKITKKPGYTNIEVAIDSSKFNNNLTNADTSLQKALETIDNLATGYTDSHYTHSQVIPSATWTIPHSLGKYPSIRIKDMFGNNVHGEVEDVDSNKIVVTFISAFKGVAYLN